jgi:CRP-like cAMP-binding protein
MFQRLLPRQSLEILKICRPRSFSDREVVFEYGHKSAEMHILLSGTLAVNASDGTRIAELSPITSVGEMGVITGEPRTATVVAFKRASVFELSKIKLEVLLKKYPDIGFVIYRNIIGLLSERLDNTNKDLISCQQELAEIKSTGILS